MPTPPRQLTPQELAELKSMWGDQQISNTQIAQRFGVGLTTLGRWKARYALPNRRITPACDEALLDTVLEALRAAPIRISEAARRAGVTPATVLKWQQQDPEVRGRIEQAQRDCFEQMQQQIREGGGKTLRLVRQGGPGAPSILKPLLD